MSRKFSAEKRSRPPAVRKSTPFTESTAVESRDTTTDGRRRIAVDGNTRSVYPSIRRRPNGPQRVVLDYFKPTSGFFAKRQETRFLSPPPVSGFFLFVFETCFSEDETLYLSPPGDVSVILGVCAIMQKRALIESFPEKHLARHLHPLRCLELEAESTSPPLV